MNGSIISVRFFYGLVPLHHHKKSAILVIITSKAPVDSPTAIIEQTMDGNTPLSSNGSAMDRPSEMPTLTSDKGKFNNFITGGFTHNIQGLKNRYPDEIMVAVVRVNFATATFRIKMPMTGRRKTCHQEKFGPFLIYTFV